MDKVLATQVCQLEFRLPKPTCMLDGCGCPPIIPVLSEECDF